MYQNPPKNPTTAIQGGGKPKKNCMKKNITAYSRYKGSKGGIIFDLFLVPRNEQTPFGTCRLLPFPVPQVAEHLREADVFSHMLYNSMEAQYLLVTYLGYAVLYCVGLQRSSRT